MKFAKAKLVILEDSAVAALLNGEDRDKNNINNFFKVHYADTIEVHLDSGSTMFIRMTSSEGDKKTISYFGSYYIEWIEPIELT